ncbi:MAG TPA: hypothetical protein VFH71_08645 [Rhodanobacteraceae bacterium]|nr:hypothetical protein [Rhodanobacteraceae bacterium]
MRGYQGPFVILASAAALCACNGEHRNADPTAGVAPSAAGTNLQVLESNRFGFRIAYPKGWTARRDFRGGYLANGSWKTYATPDSQGTPVAALVMTGSNHVTAAEVRIGVSRVAEEVKTCVAPPSSLRGGSTDRERIDGADFTRFEASDAAMSHYLDVHSYRAVHDDACYAIDLLVYGTNPQVYDPPATPPFSKAQAFAAMRDVLRTFHFTR